MTRLLSTSTVSHHAVSTFSFVSTLCVGIVVADKVIAFTTCPASVGSETTTDGLPVEHNGQYYFRTEHYGLKHWLKEAVLAICAQLINYKHSKNGVYRESLEEFVNNTGGVIVYKYGAAAEKNEPASFCRNPIKANSRENACEVAKYFAQNPQLFGKYSFVDRNCEHFAMFCRTTRLTVKDLKEEHTKLKESDKTSFDMSFLFPESKEGFLTASLARYVQRGYATFFIKQ